jgi:hypothetical protein
MLVTQHIKFNLKNQHTSTWAPLVCSNGGPWGSLKFRLNFDSCGTQDTLTPEEIICSLLETKTKLRGLSPRANYTDRATAACRRNDCQLLRIEGATWSTWRIPTAVFSVFWTGAATFLSSSFSVVITRLSGPLSRHATFFFLVVPGIEPGPPDL